MYIELLKEMFLEMVIKKDATLIPHYYHPDFLLFTNAERVDYDGFLKMHEKYYSRPIKYELAFDEDTWVEQNEKVAGRIWVTTTMPNEESKQIELILIAQYKEQKIYRLWEVTYPDWSNLPTFTL